MKNMGKVAGKFILFYVSLVFALAISVIVLAEDYNSVMTVPSGQSGIVRGIFAGIKPSDILTISGDTVTFHGDKYYALTTKEKNDFMESALGSIKSSGLSNITKNKLYNFVYERDSSTAKAVEFLIEDTSANFTWALKVFRGTTGDKISKGLGIFCILVFGFLGVGMVWDIAYLTLPMFSGLLNGLASGDVSGGVGGYFKSAVMHNGGATQKPFGVSAVAWKVNREIDLDVNEGRSGLKVYMNRRVPELIICGVCLGYVVTGELFGLVGWVIDNFSIF